MKYIEPEMEITRFDENEIATDVAVLSGHRPGGGDVGYEDFL